MTESVDTVARKLARKFRGAWWADPRDIEQEVRLAIVASLDQYDAARGPFGAWAWRVGHVAATRWLWRFSSPASTSSHRPDAVRGMTAAPLREIDDYEAQDAPEASCARVEWHERVRAALRESLAATRQADLAFDALLHQDDPERVALRHRVTIEDVQRAARRARGLARRSPRLRALAEENDA